jgi:GAF domain-containing protein/CheY-like chemotaxis protein/HAMP domain-containing protein
MMQKGLLSRLLPGQLARAVLLWFVLLTLIPLFVVGGLLIVGVDALGVNGIYSQTQRTALDTLTGDAERRQLQLVDWTAARQRDIAILAGDPRLQAAAKTLATTDPSDSRFLEARNTLEARLTQVKGQEFGELFIATLDGRVLYSTDPASIGQTLSTPGLEQAKDAAFLSPIYYEVSNSAPQLVVLQAVVEPGTIQAAAFIGGRLDDNKLRSLAAGGSDKLNQVDVNAYLVNAQSQPVTRQGFEGLLPPIYSSPGIRTALEQLAQGECAPVGAAYNDYTGAQVYGAYCAMPALDAVVIEEIPVTAALQPVTTSLLAGVAVLVVLFIATLIIAMLATRSIVAPINAMTEVTGRVAGGDLSQQLHIARRDELGQLATSFNRMTERLRESYGNLETIVARRTEQLRLAAEVSRAVSELSDVDRLLPQVVEQVRERYDFYYVGLFLLDEVGAWAVLRAGTGEAGLTMLGRQHRLEVGGQSMVGWVAARNLPRIALDVGGEAVRFNNPLLPDTRSEAALPLRAGGRLIGVIDFQSTRPAAFGEDDLVALQSLADQVAVAVDNARLYSEATRRSEQRRQVVEIAQSAAAKRDADLMLQEVCDRMREAFGYYNVNAALVEGDELVVRASAAGLGHPLAGLRVPLAAGLLGAAVESARPVLAPDVSQEPRFVTDEALPDTRAELVVPLVLGDRVIGAIDVENDRVNSLGPADEDLIVTLAGLLAVALDNVRLFQQTADSLREVSALYRQYTREAWAGGAAQDVAQHEYVAPGATTTAATAVADLERTVASGEVTEIAGEQRALAAPINLRGEAIGALAVYDERADREWSEDDRALLERASAELGLALENARLFRQTQELLQGEQERRRLADTLREVAEAVSSTLELNQLLDLILDQLQKVVAFDSASVQLLEGDDLVIIGGRGFPEPEKVIGLRFPVHGNNPNYEIVRTRAPFVVLDPQARYPHMREAPHDRIRSWMGVPLIYGERLLGMITLDSTHENAFDEGLAQLALAFANQAAAAIRNAQLFEESERRARQFETLSEITRAAAAALTLDQVLEAIYTETIKVVPADGMFIALHDKATDDYVYELLYDEGQRYPRRNNRPAPGSNMYRAITERRTVMVLYTPEEYQEQLRTNTGVIGTGKLSISLLYTPIILGDEVIGVISAQTYAFNSYTPEHAALFGAIANQTAAAVQNARLFEESQRRARQFETLNEISRAVSSALSLEQILEAIYQHLQAVIPLEAFFVAMYDRATEGLRYELLYDHGQRYPATTGTANPGTNLRRALDERRTVTVLRTAEELERLRGEAGGRLGDTSQPSASLLYSPLMIGEEVIGVISAQTYQLNSYTPEHTALFGAVANQVSSAIQNARLFAQTQRRAEELAVLNEISRAVSGVLSLEELYQVLHQQVGRLMETNSFYVALYDAPSQMVSIPYMIERGQREPRQPRSVTRGLTGWVIRNRQALNLTEGIEEHHARLGVELVGAASKCWLGVPMFLGEQIMGLIAVQDYEREHVFSDDDQRILQAIASQAAVAVQNARLFEETQRRAEELGTLYELGSALSSRLEIERLIEVVFDQVLRLTGASSVTIALGPDESQQLRVHSLDAGRRLPVINIDVNSPTSFMAYVTRSGKPLLVRDMEQERASLPVPGQTRGDAPRSWLGVPLYAGERPVGALAVQSYEAGKFDQNREQLLRQVAVQVAIALENARLFESTAQARQQAEERLRESVALQAVSRSVSRTLELNEVLDIVLEQIIYTLGFEFSTISLVDEREGVVKVVRGIGVSDEQIAGARRHLDEPDIMADVIRTGKTEIIDQWDERFDREMFEREGHANLLRVWTPIVSRGRNIGLVEAGYHKANRSQITDADVRLLQAFVDQAAIGIENSRLFAETQRRAVQLSTASEVSRAATSILDPEQLVRETVNLIRERFNFYYVALFLLDADGHWAVLRQATGEAGRVLMERHHRLEVGGQSMVGTAISQRSARIALDVGSEAVRFANPLLPDTRSEIALPLRVGDRVVGALDAQSTEAGAFSPEDIDVLQSMADQLATTIDNARLFQDSLARTREVTALFDASQQINATLDLDSLYEIVARRLLETTRVQAATVSDWMRDDNRVVTRAHVSSGPDKVVDVIGTSYTLDLYPSKRRVLNEGAPLMLRLSDAETDVHEVQLLRRAHMGTLLMVPLAVRDNVVGLVTLYDEDPQRRFSTEEMRFASTLVNQAAVAIQNARLFAETQVALSETATLYQAGRAIAAAVKPQDILAAIMESVASPDIERVVLMLFSPERRANGYPEYFESVASWGPRAADVALARYTPEQLPIIFLANAYSPVTFDDVHSDPRIDPRSRQMLGALGIRSLGAIPLTLAGGNQWIGLLLVETLEPHVHRFNDRELRLYHTLAGQAAVQLDRVRAEASLAQRAEELRLLFDVTTASSATTRLEEVLQRSAQALYAALDDAQIALFIREADGESLRVGATAGYRVVPEEAESVLVGQGVVGWVAQTGQPAVIGDVTQDSRYHQLDPSIRSELAVPLLAGQQVIGVLNIERPQLQAFGQQDLRLLTTLSSTLAASIQNARLFEEIQEANVRLREVDRLKSEFLASMSHELRTPLNSIIGFSRVILKGIDGPLTDLQTTDLTAIHSAGQHLLGLINDILDLSKIEAGKLELAFDEVNLQEVIKSVMSTAVGLTKDRPIELLQDVPDDLPTVWADQMRVRQIVLNLVSNATKFTDHGSITVRAELVEEPPLHGEGDLPLIDFVKVSVIDTGIGIAEKDMPKLFKAFQQVDASSSRRAGGTGLGLNITKQLVEMHGGRIGLNSMHGQGSTFWFTVPTRPYERPPEPQEPEIPAADDRPLVLAVDDDPGVITLYKRYLEPQGFRVIGVNRSEEVMERVRQHQPFVITLDVLMPHKDGWQVIQELKRHPETRHIPVIMASIVADQGRGFSLGASDYLVKPILEQDLLAALKRINGEGTERTVLIIDDEADNIRLIRRVLEGDAHYRVFEAQGGRAGLEAVKNLRPHIIVLDLMMPEMDGFDVLTALKSDPETRDIPVIVVTAKDITEADRERLNGHIGALLRKGPLTESELLQDVSRVLQRAQQHRTAPHQG